MEFKNLPLKTKILIITFKLNLLICVNIGLPIKCWTYKTPLSNFSIMH